MAYEYLQSFYKDSGGNSKILEHAFVVRRQDNLGVNEVK